MATAERSKVRLMSRSDTPSGARDPGPEAALWETLRNSNDPAEFEAFLRLFPTSRYAEEAKRRPTELDGCGRTAKRRRSRASLNRRRRPARQPPEVARPARSAGSQPDAEPAAAGACPVVTAANVPAGRALPDNTARGKPATRTGSRTARPVPGWSASRRAAS